MTDSLASSVTVSVVSHGQGEMVAALLSDLAACPDVHSVLLTHNVPEAEVNCPASLRPRLELIRNDGPKGFAANHNQAFQHCRTRFFAVVNPDIRLDQDPFPLLIDVAAQGRCGVAAPAVRSPEGALEDSARHFPTIPRLMAKLLGRGDGRHALAGIAPVTVDWTAGMFLVFRAEVFRDVGGFDEGFFLYYEDVDICVRLWRAGRQVVIHPGVSVVHAAQRASRRRPRYMAWHLSSMARYFMKHLGRLPQTGAGT